MFRSLSEDDGGFVNEGLEICDENGKNCSGRSFRFDDSESSATKIQITRSKYDQQKLHDEMMYKKPPSKSSEFFAAFFFLHSWINVLKSKARERSKVKGS